MLVKTPSVKTCLVPAPEFVTVRLKVPEAVLFAASYLVIVTLSVVVSWKLLKEIIKNSISHSRISLENQERELKLYFHSCATNLKSETIMLNLLRVLKPEF